MACPRRRVSERTFRLTDKHRARPDRRIVAIGADSLPSRAVVQFNEHLVIERALPGLWRERFVDASLPGMSVDCGPDSLARLGIFRKALPIRADTAVHPLIARPQDALILAPSPMPDPPDRKNLT